MNFLKKISLKNILIYLSIAIFFIIIFLVGLLIYVLPISDKHKRYQDLNGNTGIKVVLDTAKDTIIDDSEVLFTLDIFSPKEKVDDYKLDNKRYTSYIYTIDLSPDYEVLQSSNYSDCLLLSNGGINRKSFKIKPIVKQGDLDVVTRVKFFDSTGCNYNHTIENEIVIHKKIFLDVTWIKQAQNFIQLVKSFFLRYFVFIWAIFLMLAFVFVVIFMRKKLKVRTIDI